LYTWPFAESVLQGHMARVSTRPDRNGDGRPTDSAASFRSITPCGQSANGSKRRPYLKASPSGTQVRTDTTAAAPHKVLLQRTHQNRRLSVPRESDQKPHFTLSPPSQPSLHACACHHTTGSHSKQLFRESCPLTRREPSLVKESQASEPSLVMQLEATIPRKWLPHP
jgi:hypothetical protein